MKKLISLWTCVWVSLILLSGCQAGPTGAGLYPAPTENTITLQAPTAELVEPAIFLPTPESGEPTSAPTPDSKQVAPIQVTPSPPTASAAEAENWQVYSQAEYGFSFLHPKDCPVTQIDAHSMQIACKQASLKVGYRFKDEQVELAANVEEGKLSSDFNFDFMGEPAEVQSGTRAVFYDGGREQERDGLVFRLWLQLSDESETLAGLSPDERQIFNFIAGSFQAAPSVITHPVGTVLDLADLGLDETESIEIGVFNPKTTASRYLYQHLVNDPDLITSLVQALDQEAKVEPEPDHVEGYELIFNLASGQKVRFGYSWDDQTGYLTRSLSEDESIALGGEIATGPEFSQLLQAEIARAEALRENNSNPVWKSRIEARNEQVGPFTLEEYQILNAGRWAPFSFEFMAIIPEEVFARRADIRQLETQPRSIEPVNVDGHTIEAQETWDGNAEQSFAVIEQDGQEIFRIPIRPPAAVSALRGFWAWNDQWVLEVEGHIILDGQELNDRLGAQESFDWQIMAGKPFAFYFKDGLAYAWYDGQSYALGYDTIVHNTCCEAGLFDVSHNQQMVWFYAHKDGVWRYVEMGLY